MSTVTETAAAEKRLTHAPAELPALLGVHRSTVYKLLKSGTIRSVRAGRRILIPAEAVTEYLQGAQ